jgi:hypothetical protein
LLASLPARSIDSIQASSRVPMLRTRAEANPCISSCSCGAWDITGCAPSASVTLAVKFITTKFVI